MEESMVHFSHEHPLLLCNKKRIHNSKCAGCDLPLRGPAYECSSCNFCLHKSCSQVPMEIQQSPLHPSHPLTLLRKSQDGLGVFICHSCNQSCYGFRYQCSQCNFVLDIECATEDDHPLISYGTEENIKHSSHRHHLTPANFRRFEGIRCSGCKLDIDGEAYVCRGCKFFLHKSCVELPEEIKHHFDTATTFGLLACLEPAIICSACKEDFHGFTYMRQSGGMEVGIDCSFLKPSLKVEQHKHSLTYFEKKVRGMKCSACGNRCKAQIFRCVKCNFNLHFSCAPILRTIKHECHIDPLTLKKLEGEDETEDHYCDACEERRIPNQLVYYCEECDFAVHIECVLSEVLGSSNGGISQAQLDQESDPPEEKGTMH
ncbi:hypothetical protein HS088_TW23G00178 [Tripterygium wilfordii]|uniref:Phorbol-ester/DAG-type domain-containing protein n=1 Tax=Tripterygium wilfordii TaxID=458696 RepID=A0A7J7BV86_TRIWF|nr:uncharacterized protein LOC119993293 [Tripterygium wilfordii]KAF5725456.1 hypothetical protein HS088_TW23G00178 [Tripterygium wilfordii]